MKLVRILEVKAPKVTRESPYDCFELLLDFGDGKPIKSYQNRLSHRVFMTEQELLRKGVDSVLLSNYHDAVREEAEYDSEDIL